LKEDQGTRERQREAEIDSLKKTIKDLHLMHTQQKIALLNALKDTYGSEVYHIIERANGKACRETYQKMNQSTGEQSIDDLIHAIWEPLRNQGLEFSMDRTSDGVQMKCTKCPIADLYKQANGTEWGYHLYCAADQHIVDAFNPKIGLRRTKTLMEGHDSCDHFYYLKNKP
jgi:predicted ArsR family transcriptional regulator